MKNLKIVFLTIILISVLLVQGCAALFGTPPPTSPHKPIGKYKVCVDCHAEGINGAVQTDHPKRPNCTKCHIYKPKKEKK